jgi:hypothetical protein
MGTLVEIIAEDGYWRQVVTPEPYTAWCTNLGLVEMTPEETDEYLAAPKYICTAQHSGVYTSQSQKSRRLSDLTMGCLVRIVYTESKNPKPSVKSKWAEVMLPDGRKGWTPLEDLAEFVVKIDVEKDSELAEEYLYEIIKHEDFPSYCTEQDHLNLSNISTKEYFNGSYASALVKNGKFDSALNFAREFVNDNGYTAYNPYSVVIMNNGNDMNLDQLRIFESDIDKHVVNYNSDDLAYQDLQVVRQLIKNLT